MIPIIVGVADFKNKTNATPADGTDEPLALILRAIDLALADTGLPKNQTALLKASVDAVHAVRPWSWAYPDLAASIGEGLGVSIAHGEVSHHGGNSPAKFLDEASRRVSLGESRVSVVAGGEAIHSLMRYLRDGKDPKWTPTDEQPMIAGGLKTPSARTLSSVHGIGIPIQVYPLYENGYRAHYGQTHRENHEESARLYGEFAKVAEAHPMAWNYGERALSKEEIGHVSEKNRMICLPYPLLMNAFNNVNVSAAVLVTSTEYATQLGIPEDKWIYPLGGAGISENEHFYLRPNFYSSPAVSYSIDAALRVSGLAKNDIDLYDFYSCFPIVPKVACKHLGLPTTGQSKPITLLGGLTSFGGAGNNYSMHAITEMTRLLRKGRGSSGLILANGGVMSYQHVVCLSSQPRKEGIYPDQAPLPLYVNDVPVPQFDETAQGEAIIETYTVQFDRDGAPQTGYVVGRLTSNNHRFVANHADEFTLKELSRTDQEIIGRKGTVGGDPDEPQRNLFSFARPDSKL